MYRVIWKFKVYPFDSFDKAQKFKEEHPGAELYAKVYECR